MREARTGNVSKYCSSNGLGQSERLLILLPQKSGDMMNAACMLFFRIYLIFFFPLPQGRRGEATKIDSAYVMSTREGKCIFPADKSTFDIWITRQCCMTFTSYGMECHGTNERGREQARLGLFLPYIVALPLFPDYFCHPVQYYTPPLAPRLIAM